MDKQSEGKAANLFAIFGLGIIIFSYLHLIGDISYSERIVRSALYTKIVKLASIYWVIKLIFSLLTASIIYLVPSLRVIKKYHIKDKPKWKKIWIISFLLFQVPILTYTNIDLVYIILAGGFHIYATNVFFSIRKNNLDEDGEIFGVNKSPHDEMSISVPTRDNGDLHISKPDRSIRVNGGNGSGKTVLIQHMLKAFIKKGYCGVVYDLEGDPTEYNPNIEPSKNPFYLGRTVMRFAMDVLKTKDAATGMVKYELFTDWGLPKIGNVSKNKEEHILREYKRIVGDELEINQVSKWDLEEVEKGIFHLYKKNEKHLEYYEIEQKGNEKQYRYVALPCRIGVINFTDPLKSVRVNPVNKKYITKEIQLDSVIEIFVKSVDLELVKKTDFWAKTGISITKAIAKRLHRSYPKYLTIPHIITLLNSDYNDLLEWIESDSDAAMVASSTITAWKNKADGQLAGSIATAQSSMTKLLDPMLFYILSPSEEDEFSLEVSNKDNPALLIIGNSQPLRESTSPLISFIINTCMINLNRSDKRKSFLFIDEFPTVTFNPNEIANFPNTARKKKAVFCNGSQTDAQEIDKYGKEKFGSIRDTQGNYFQGATGNLDTAKYWEQKLSTKEKLKTSITTQHEGSGSMSESLQKENVLKAREIMEQRAGHFTGHVAGGNPYWFSTQFAMFNESVPDYIPDIQNYFSEEEDEEIRKEKIDLMIKNNYERIKEEVAMILSGEIIES